MRATMTYDTKNEGRGARRTAVLLALAALAGCGSSADDAAKFAGEWTFESGQLAAACGQTIQAPAPFQLRGLSVTLKRVNNSAFDLIAGTAQKCTLHFSVSGNKATAAANQPCILDVGSFGEQTLNVTTWTLDLTGDHLVSTTSALVLICSLNGSGVLARGGPDGGVTPSDGGVDATPGTDATAEVGADAAAEAGSDAATEAGSDAATEAGSDAATEAGSDAASTETGTDAETEAGVDATAG